MAREPPEARGFAPGELIGILMLGGEGGGLSDTPFDRISSSLSSSWAFWASSSCSFASMLGDIRWASAARAACCS